ncbi:MAG: outer membrane lipoprotein-sorting protein [Pseudomonadota bacterium]
MKSSRNKIFLPACALIVAAAFALGPVDAGQAGKLSASQILAKCDDFHFGQKDAVYKIDVTLIDKNGKKTYMKLENYQKGNSLRLIRFVEPKDLDGFAVLNKDENTMYVYEPSLGKVRRIASHAKKQSMLGQDFTLDEASIFRYESVYDPVLVDEDDKTWHLELKQKQGKDRAWPIVHFYVDKKKFHASMIEFCDAAGKTIKTEKRSNLKKFDGLWVTARMKMTDHGKQHSTIYDIVDARFDQDLPADLFTKRSLIREE